MRTNSTARSARTKKLLLGLVVLAFIITVTTGVGGTSAGAAPTAGQPVDLNIVAAAIPGSLKPGSEVFVTITVTGAAARSGIFQVGFAGKEELKSPNQKLTQPSAGLNLWSPISLTRGQVKRLTFSITVQPPAGAAGPGMWCLTALASPNLNSKTPPAWTQEKTTCYRVVA